MVWYRRKVKGERLHHGRLCVVELPGGSGREAVHQVVLVLTPDEATPELGERVRLPAGDLRAVRWHQSRAVWAERVGPGFYEARYVVVARGRAAGEDPMVYRQHGRPCAPLGCYPSERQAIAHGVDAIDLAMAMSRGEACPLKKLPALERDPRLKDWEREAARRRRRSGVASG